MTIALDPTDRNKRPRPATYLARAAAAHIRAFVDGTTPERKAKEMFEDDKVTDVILKAASTPAAISNVGWAGALAGQAVEDSVMAITSSSAAADLMSRGLKLNFDGYASIRVPGRLLSAADAGSWVGEGQPIPLRAQLMTNGPTLTPHKLCVIVSLTYEMIASSNIEAISGALLSEAAALKLDATLFGAQADDGITPGGILNGIVPLVGTTGGGPNAIMTDVRGLMKNLVAAGAGRAPVLCMSPTQATPLAIMAGPKFNLPVLLSNSIPDGTVIAVEASSFASAFSPVPEFAVGTSAILHFEDTNPADISTPPATVAAPVKSMFQTDSLALRMVLRAAWGLRAPHVAVVTNTTWLPHTSNCSGDR